MDPRLPPRHPDYTVSLSSIGRPLCNLYAKAVPPDRNVRTSGSSLNAGPAAVAGAWSAP